MQWQSKSEVLLEKTLTRSLLFDFYCYQSPVGLFIDYWIRELADLLDLNRYFVSRLQIDWRFSRKTDAFRSASEDERATFERCSLRYVGNEAAHVKDHIPGV